MVKLFSATRVGILGGGQLARMLAEAASRLGLCPMVLTRSKSDPAALICPQSIVGSLDDGAALRRLIDETEAIVFESEFVDTALLAAAAKDRVNRFFPSLSALAKTRDKVSQKEILIALGIPSAAHIVYEGGAPVEKWVVESAKVFGHRCVLKWGRMGYDGKGVFLLTDMAQLNDAIRFCNEAINRGLSLFMEELVPFQRELALVACRSVSAEFIAYPLVLSTQQGGICLDIKGPATAFGVPAASAARAEESARRIAEACQLVGSFAVEFFELSTGELWVNEIAPRVHNSGHYTIEACPTSQFENHWRAVLGLSLGVVNSWPAFLMGNILGPEGVSREGNIPLPRPGAHCQLHWYGKQRVSPGRKMGHLTAVMARLDEVRDRELEIRKCREDWVSFF